MCSKLYTICTKVNGVRDALDKICRGFIQSLKELTTMRKGMKWSVWVVKQVSPNFYFSQAVVDIVLNMITAIQLAADTETK